jgi:arabinosaccharide transport system permease protein
VKTNIFYSQKIAPYIFVLPFILSFTLFFLYPILSSIMMSFQKVLPGEVTFLGLKNYRRLMNPHFYKALSNSTRYTFWTLVVLIPLPMIFAVLLDSKRMPLRNIFRASLFMPILTSTIVAGTVFRLLFSEMDTGFANSVLHFFGFESRKWLRMSNTAMFLMVLLCSWRWMGVNILYFLSGLQAIPKELYEAADIDGAGVWGKFRHITFPLLKPVSIYVLTISIYGGFRMFEETYVYWPANSPGDIGLTIVSYLYQRGIQFNEMGLGSAIGVVLLVIVLTVNIIQLTLTGAFRKESA